MKPPQVGGPEHSTVRIDQLRRHAHAITGLQHASFDLIPNAKTAKERACLRSGLGSVGIHREFITAAARWIMEAKL